jgi:hypothetical protein
MFIGHFAVGLAAKRVAPRASLGTLFFAVQFADLLWPILVLLGIEVVRIAPGDTKFTPLEFVSYPYSHSLAFELLWAAVIGSCYFFIKRESREAIVVALCVPTHWLLDFVVHRPDLPIIPGGTRYGLGLWNSMAGTLAVEIALFVIGAGIYLRTTRAKDRTGAYALWGLLIFLLVAYIASIPGPPPPSPKAVATLALAMWLLLPWAAWADRHREVQA